MRKRGYEMTKKVLDILPPILTTLGCTSTAEGAIISRNSKVAAS